MQDLYFHGQTIDDLLNSVIENINANGQRIKPRKGWCLELTGVLLELTNPRARLSRTETRGKPFSCLGELCWYLAGNNKVDFISYYITEYKKYTEDDVIYGGYGPRFFNWKGLNQVQNIIDLLKQNCNSRKAVIQLFDSQDLTEEHLDVPCTCVLQFLIRNDTLQLVTYMRSNDVIVGLPHDIFCFTMLQEIIARSLDIELGTYKHVVGSLHIYDINKDVAQQYIGEGFQSTRIPMPPMPSGDPWPAIQLLLKAEATIRQGNPFDKCDLTKLDSYWADLVILLLVYRHSKYNNITNIKEFCAGLSSSTYRSFIDNKIGDHQDRPEQ